MSVAAALKVTTTTKKGDVIGPFANAEVSKDCVVTVNDCTAEHSTTKYNAIVMRGFLVALDDLQPDEAIKLNVNQFIYALKEVAMVPGTNEVVGGFATLSEDEKQRVYRVADEVVRDSAVRDGFVPAYTSDSSRVFVSKSTGHSDAGLVTLAKGDIAVGETAFCSPEGITMPFPLRSTVALPNDKHLRLTGGAEFMPHSCQPNLSIVIDGNTVKGIAVRPIASGELLTYNYLTTEWDIARPFRCDCNVFSCYGLIQGFKHLEPEQQQHLLPNVSEAVRLKYASPLADSATLSHITKDALLAPNAKGELAAMVCIAAGTVLCAVQRYRIGIRELFADHLRIPHSCSANTAIVEGRLCAIAALAPGERLTVNVALLAYHVPVSFACTCGSTQCRQLVEGFCALSDESKNALMNLTEPSVRLEATKNGYTIRSSSSLVCVRPNGAMGQATFAASSIAKGTRFFRTTGLVVPFPTVYTILLADNKHLLFAGGAQCLAHSCDPNVRVIVDPASSSFECVALRDIAADDLIAFNYLTTEWDMNTPFPCACAAPQCFRDIRGFRHVNDANRQLLWSSTTPIIRQLASSHCRSQLSVLDAKKLRVVHNEIRAIADIPTGEVLLEAIRYQVVSNGLVVDDVRLAHCCDPTAVLVEGRIVSLRPCAPGDAITVNVALLEYSREPFDCKCGSWNCVRTVSGFRGLPDESKNALMNLTEPSVRLEATKNGYTIRSSSSLVCVRPNGAMGQATFAASSIAKGTRFFRTTGLVVPFPTVYTILLADNKHLLFAGGAQCLAHSCDPNVRVIVDPASSSFECVALRDIAADDLIAFNYLTTEWDMNTPFPCACAAPQCFRDIRGFRHVNDANRQMLWNFATPAVRAAASRLQASTLAELDRSAVRVDASGVLRSVDDLPTGKVLLTVQRWATRGEMMVLDDAHLRHSCDANVFLVQGRLVTARVISTGEELTINVNLTEYRIASPFECSCNAVGCTKRVAGFAELSLEEKHKRMIFVDPDVRVLAIKEGGYRLTSDCPTIAIRDNGDMGQTTFAASPIRKGTHFFRSTGVVIPFPTVYTILLAPGRNLLFAGGAHCLAHSCDPNVQVLVDANGNSFELLALKDIAEGEMVSFNYLTTEWDMNVPFPCLCGAAQCYRMIRGFKHLSTQERAQLARLATPAVKELAGLHAHVGLPDSLAATANGLLRAALPIARATRLLECSNMELHPTHVSIGPYVVKHSLASNTVFVEGHLISLEAVDVGTVLTVNMCFMVYDMVQLFPDSFVSDNKGFKYLDEAVKQYDLYLCEPPVRAQAMRDGWVVVPTNNALVVRPNGDMGQTAYAVDAIPTGTLLFHTGSKGLMVPFPTMYTICVDAQRHLLFGDAAECIAHSCDPNVHVVVLPDGTLEFRMCKDVAAGTMLSFCYNTTEWAMNSTFPCLCGSEFCAKFIRGFKYLADEDRQRLWPLTSPFVRQMADTNN